MKSFGEEIKFLRQSAKLPLRTVASYLDIDQAILSKIENDKRQTTKEIVIKLATYFKVAEKDLMINYLSDKILKELKEEPYRKDILIVAEEKIAYQTTIFSNQNTIIDELKDFFINESRVISAYLFGSFARKEASKHSDIDVMIEFSKTKKHTMFDLLDIQYQLQKLLNRKVDVVEKGFVKSHAQKNVEKDLKLILRR